MPQVPPDPVFRREGTNVHTDVQIHVSQAVLGGTIRAPTLYDGEVEIKVS